MDGLSERDMVRSGFLREAVDFDVIRVLGIVGHKVHESLGISALDQVSISEDSVLDSVDMI